MLRGFVYLLSVLFTFQIYAANDLIPVDAPAKLTVAQIAKLNAFEMDALVNEIAVQWRGLNQLMRRKDGADVTAGVEALIAMRKYEGIEENIESVIGALRTEVGRLDKGTVVLDVIRHSLITLGQITSRKPDRYLEEIMDLRDEAFKRMGNNQKQEEIASLFAFATNEISKRETPTLNLMEQIEKLENGEGKSQRRLIRMEEWLKENVTGQPEVIDRIVNLEYRDRLFAKSRKCSRSVMCPARPSGHRQRHHRARMDRRQTPR